MPGNRDEMIAFLEKQGAKVTKTKKGLLIWNNGNSAVVHNTPSDRRAVDNEIARFRMIGLVHPEDKRGKDKRQMEKRQVATGPGGYPSYLSAKMTPRVRERMLRLLESKGWPLTVRVNELREFGANTEVSRALYAIGYRYPLGKMPKGGYVWEAPEEIAKLHDQWEANRKVEEEPDVEIVRDVEVKLREQPKPVPEEEPEFYCEICQSTTHSALGHSHVDDHQGEEKPEPVEFIDERDSWVVDPEELLGSAINRMVQDRLSTLRAVGIDYEIRVWRKEK